MIVRNDQAGLSYYSFGNGTFYGQSGSGSKIGQGFLFEHYWLADWTGDGSPELLVQTEDGQLLLYPYGRNTFYGQGELKKPGDGWKFTHAFVMDWTGDMVADMLIRNHEGELLLYASENGEFPPIGRKVGVTGELSAAIAGYFTGNGSPDLLLHNGNGEMLLFPFRNGTFAGYGEGIKVGHGFRFEHAFAEDWTGDGITDLLVDTE